MGAEGACEYWLPAVASSQAQGSVSVDLHLEAAAAVLTWHTRLLRENSDFKERGEWVEMYPAIFLLPDSLFSDHSTPEIGEMTCLTADRLV